MIKKVGYHEERPWGNFTILSQGDFFQVKQLNIKPQSQISLHKHFKHNENYYILSGSAKIRIENDSFILGLGENVL